MSYEIDKTTRVKIEASSPSKVVGPGSYDLDKPMNIPLYKIDPSHN